MKSANYHSARPACPGDVVIETNSGFVKLKFEVFINKTLNYVSLQLCITTLIVYYMYSNRENVIDRLSKEPGLYGLQLYLPLLVFECIFVKVRVKLCFGFSQFAVRLWLELVFFNIHLCCDEC